MDHFFKSFTDGYLDLFRLAPLPGEPDEVSDLDFDNLPGYSRDAANLAGDWARVGGYLRDAIEAETEKA